MSDCRYGVSPVNYPDPDPDPCEGLDDGKKLLKILLKKITVREPIKVGSRLHDYISIPMTCLIASMRGERYLYCQGELYFDM